MQRPNLARATRRSDGTRYERIAPPAGTGCVTGDCGTGVWLDAAGFATPALYTLGTAPRTSGDVRTPHRNNWDFVASEGRHVRPGTRPRRRSASRC